MAKPTDPHRPPTLDSGEGARETTHAQALGHAIKVIRTSLNLGRRELARRAGLSYSYLAEIENGTKQLSQTAQAEVARALGVSVAELWTATEEWARALKSGSDELEASATDLMSEAPYVASAPRGIDDTAGAFDPRGARARQLRWFSDTAARRSSSGAARLLAVSRAELMRERAAQQGSKREPETQAARSPSSGDERDAHLETVVERIRLVLEGMSEEDRERVLDLAERLGGTEARGEGT